ncbi:MAG: outer membrane beta-barrel protein [Brumimicrobium sp.]|nr:outer membrane beta-barrel protein [Brumimicrobium sp.]
MPKQILVLLFLSNLFFSTAQYDKDEIGLTSRYRPGMGWFFSGLSPYKAGKLRKYDRWIVDITHCNWIQDKKVLPSPWNSIGINGSVMFDKILSVKERKVYGLGWGLTFSHFSIQDPNRLIRDFNDKTTEFGEFQPGQEPDGYRFGANYLEIPVEFRFRTAGYKHFKLMVGGKIGYQLNAFTQRTERVDDKMIKSKRYDFPDANKLRYGVTMRMGIRNWAVYGAYYFSPLFTNRASVQLNPFTVGLSISLF